MKKLAITLALIPGLAAASEFTWTVTVVDGPTHEEKTYRPPDDDFAFTPGHGFSCGLAHVEQKGSTFAIEVRDLTCEHKDELRPWLTRTVCAGNLSDQAMLGPYNLKRQLMAGVTVTCSP